MAGGEMSGHPRLAAARVMTPVEAAYVGAFVEGEGHIRYAPSPSRGDMQTSMTVAQNNVEVISALLRATGVGRVNLRGNGKLWTWQLSAINDMVAVAKQIAPFSEKAQRFLTCYES